MQLVVPRLLVAGLRGGSGKTLLSLGLAASFRSRGLVVAPFKKGPDYIDASWLTRASGRPCRNLDCFLFPPPTVLSSFAGASEEADIALIEGNRGLYDGMDAEGTFSSAELAKLLGAPVILAIDATKTTRTAAALVLGCQTMDPAVPLAGVVLNRVAGTRHESVLRQSIEGTCGIPVLGVIPKLPADIFPERHLGLVPPQETEVTSNPLEQVGRVAEKHLDLDRILEMAKGATSIEVPDLPQVARVVLNRRTQSPEECGAESTSSERVAQVVEKPRIGVFQDAAFQFYYPENLEAIIAAGGCIVEISPLRDVSLPPVDALYLGGGFPETLALGLSENSSFLTSVRDLAEAGLPIYAECGGAVYLGKHLHYKGNTFSMAGVLPVEFGFQKKPRGHGYTVIETIQENPFFEIGQTFRGHEFHYTYLQSPPSDTLDFAFRMHRGYGFDGHFDGLIKGNVLASYTHLHALGAESWAPALVRIATVFASRPTSSPES